MNNLINLSREKMNTHSDQNLINLIDNSNNANLIRLIRSKESTKINLATKVNKVYENRTI